MSPLEIEVKFFLEDPDAVRERIASTGAVFSGKSMENNIRFEDRDHSLILRKSLLRLRRTDDRNLLTFKGESPDTDGEFKIHRETEVTVNDFDAMVTILDGIGYRPAQRYEKIRETWRLDDTELCLDRMPYGNFLEIEGERETIKDTARQLGLNWSERIVDNYLSMFERLKTELRLGFHDVTFDNFQQVRVNFGSYKHLFTAG